MRTLGFVISKKENEKRRAIVFEDIKKIKNKKYVYFEEGYGNILGFSDDDILKLGCNILDSEKIYDCDIICDPKIGDSVDIDKIKNKIVFGWIHATQNYDITQHFIDNKLTGYAWEKMYDGKRHIFMMNNQIAGEAAVIHAMLLSGKLFENLDIAILGNGNTSKGAQKILNKFDNRVRVYNSSEEKKFKEEIFKYDIIINCILWDVTRKDHIIYKNDLKKLKRGCLIIDVSCDHNGGIESSIPTTINNPMYEVDGVYHYAVDHTPSIFYNDSSVVISNEVVNYIDDLIEGKDNAILDNALIINNGIIVDNEIIKYQQR
ncbi:MAG: N(5)-(carboxyethyl)ornithine synthase [Bacilli bacterium]